MNRPTAEAAETAVAPSTPVVPAGNIQESLRVRSNMAVGGIGFQIYLPALLAQESGYLRSMGVEMAIEDVKGGADAAKALVTGQVDFASLAMDHVAKYKSQGADLVMLALYTRGPGLSLVVDSRYKNEIKSIKDLQNRKVGVTSLGSGTHEALAALLAKNGVSAEAVEVFGIGSKLSDAFKEGKVVAAMNLDPAVTEVVRSGQGFVLYDLRTIKDTHGLYGADYPFVGLATRADVVRDKTELVHKVVAAVERSLHWLHTHSAEEVAAKVPAQYKGDEQVYVDALRKLKELFPADGLASEPGIQVVISNMRKNKAIPDNLKIDPGALFDRRFLDSARTARGKEKAIS